MADRSDRHAKSLKPCTVLRDLRTNEAGVCGFHQGPGAERSQPRPDIREQLNLLSPRPSLGNAGRTIYAGLTGRARVTGWGHETNAGLGQPFRAESTIERAGHLTRDTGLRLAGAH